MSTDPQIYLASSSPRRQELLRLMGYDFRVVLKEVDESYPADLHPAEVAVYISEKKVRALASRSIEHPLAANAVPGRKARGKNGTDAAAATTAMTAMASTPRARGSDQCSSRSSCRLSQRTSALDDQTFNGVAPDRTVTPSVPITVAEEITGSLGFYNYRGRCIYCDMIQQDVEQVVAVALRRPRARPLVTKERQLLGAGHQPRHDGEPVRVELRPRPPLDELVAHARLEPACPVVAPHGRGRRAGGRDRGHVRPGLERRPAGGAAHPCGRAGDAGNGRARSHGNDRADSAADAPAGDAPTVDQYIERPRHHEFPPRPSSEVCERHLAERLSIPGFELME